eukprot:GEMP01102939.1.p1 GENE.GEMP01102939.1~~GEMP01102939.1.p1  ORF type:complete len:130 (+),score=17.77 GEMP01102939.1:51-392(+)
MTKGTTSFGMRHSKSHGSLSSLSSLAALRQPLFPRSEKTLRLLHVPDQENSQLPVGMKAIRRKTTGTGRTRYLKTLPRRAKHGFREGTTPAARKKIRASRETHRVRSGFFCRH